MRSPLSHTFLALLCSTLLSSAALAQELALSESTQATLSAQKGKRVTLRLRSGQELTGTVRDANARMVVLATLQGREFFDAAVPLDAVEAVLVRTKQQ